jgi:hypothetical protein
VVQVQTTTAPRLEGDERLLLRSAWAAGMAQMTVFTLHWRRRVRGTVRYFAGNFL